jgi:hypothetical protein
MRLSNNYTKKIPLIPVRILDKSTALSHRYFDIEKLSIWTEGLPQKLISHTRVKTTNKYLQAMKHA